MIRVDFAALAALNREAVDELDEIVARAFRREEEAKRREEEKLAKKKKRQRRYSSSSS